MLSSIFEIKTLYGSFFQTDMAYIIYILKLTLIMQKVFCATLNKKPLLHSTKLSNKK